MNEEQKENLSKIELLESAPHFSYLTFEDKQSLVPHMELAQFLPGDPLIRDGEAQNKVFFVIEGYVEIMKSSANGDMFRLARHGRGAIIGESSLLPADIQSTVVVRAEEKTLALCLPAKAFKDLFHSSPRTAIKLLFDIIKLLRQRLNETSNKMADLLSETNGDEKSA